MKKRPQRMGREVYIPEGKYITLKDFTYRMGWKSITTACRAVESGHIKGAVRFNGMWLIPTRAVPIDFIIKPEEIDCD